MNIKAIAAATLLAIATSGAFAALANPIDVEPLNDGSGKSFGTFAGLSSGDAFSFDAANGQSLDLASIFSSYTTDPTTGAVLTGFRLTGVLFDGVSFGSDIATIDSSGHHDQWNFSVASLSEGPHILVIRGDGTPSLDHIAFNGSVTISQPVPEPGTYALMLIGVGALGFVHRRRKTS